MTQLSKRVIRCRPFLASTFGAFSSLALLSACSSVPTRPSPAAPLEVAGAACGGLPMEYETSANAVEPETGRAFYLSFPCGLEPGEDVTLILNLHGGGSSGQWQRLYFPAGELADSYNLVVATPTSLGGEPFQMWVADSDDAYLKTLTELLISSFGAENITSFWLAGHSQGGLTSTRIVCSDYFGARVDGFTSLAGGRVGMKYGGDPTCDYSHIFETGDDDSAGRAGIPDTSPLADRFGCKPKAAPYEIVDTEAGLVYDPRSLAGKAPREGWGGKAAPGTAEVSLFADCNDGKIVADIIRRPKGHTEGLEPNITEEIVKLMTSIPGGKIRSLQKG